MPSKRTSISKRIRFEVFKRDSFRCQYCGAVPPFVILHIDHITPVAIGGSNDIDNLITSCASCNLGKSDVPLTEIPKTLQEKAKEVAEREAQIKGYNAVLQEKADRIEYECWRVASALEAVEYLESYSRRRLQSIKKFVLTLPFVDVIDAAEITLAKFGAPLGERGFKYFCGVCWKKIREAEHG